MRLAQLIVLGLVMGVAAGWWLQRDGESTDDTAARPAAAVPPPAAANGVGAVPVEQAATAIAAPTPAVTGDTPSGLLLPVQGIAPSQLQDTFTDARSEGRVHDAIDIMAAAGTPVLAVADGHVEKLFDSKRGGLTLYQFEPSGRWCYYYAHLQRYADGLAEKQTIKRGDVIGYVGSTGNANPEAPHLHFEVHALGPEKQWWKGESLNPYPLLKKGDGAN
ncbi:M23 family metallopeptidase [Stenotrophomonas maltophilia]|nr:M23 family metallopeptidase [Stenotrophomonas maltophilia]